jgi:hypothetical protein
VSSRADKFLEGFKLGSLGVRSKKPLAVVPDEREPEKNKEIVILHTRVGKKPSESFNLVWRDIDGYRYSLETFSRIGWTVFIVYIRGKNSPSNDLNAMNYDWVASMRSPGFDKQYKKQMFEEWIALIKEQGIKGLLEQYKLGTFKFAAPSGGNMSWEFQEWLHEKEKA